MLGQSPRSKASDQYSYKSKKHAKRHKSENMCDY